MLTPIDQTRNVLAVANARQCEPAFVSRYEEAPGFEPFDATAAAEQTCQAAAAIAHARQQSRIDPFALSGLAQGDASASAGPRGVIHSISSMLFEVTFE
ncbi:MAG: hypothetical protein ACREE7_00345, partial [Dongiaceae bacterium]